ncbi:riboflavin synthase subunit beta [Sungkyunkwania multivorans]|uniref:Riboflavin synthase subunit beta n=1 Tax=Sungkyunkwania multivorans TaxID=1173618 RepID=A0ABW3CU88_9FLAO
MGALFKSRKNKRFNYQPRYYEHDGEGSPFSIDSRFAKYRKTLDNGGGLKEKFSRAYSEMKEPADRNVTRRLVIIIAILLFLFLWFIDFDLSIFSLTI